MRNDNVVVGSGVDEFRMCFKVESTGLADGLDIGCKRKKISSTFRCFEFVLL